jgi:hypothetical protein
MPKEALSSNRSDQGLPQGGVELSFDELARAMAEGSLSRRRALKLIAGTALAALIPSRALADEDCVRICHVPFDRETEDCDFASAETRCVSRRERRRHLENHPCDCRGRCANCLSPPQPICDPPCTEGRECVEGAPGFTFCQPICPGCPCSCFDRADGTGTACVDCFTVGCAFANDPPCLRCAEEFPGTICVIEPAFGDRICGNPCQ